MRQIPPCDKAAIKELQMGLSQIGNDKSATCMPQMPSSLTLFANSKAEYTACHKLHIKSFEKGFH